MKYDFTQTKQAFRAVEEHLGKELASVRAGRATPLILDGITVESYGSLQRIPHIANVSVSDARTLLISPWDKASIKDIVAAITAAQPGLSVSSDGAGVQVGFPDLTSERRESLVKIVHEKLEQARVALRLERDKTWSDIQEKERAGEITEDDKFAGKDELQKIVDEMNAALKNMADRKSAEVRE